MIHTNRCSHLTHWQDSPTPHSLRRIEGKVATSGFWILLKIEDPRCSLMLLNCCWQETGTPVIHVEMQWPHFSFQVMHCFTNLYVSFWALWEFSNAEGNHEVFHSIAALHKSVCFQDTDVTKGPSGSQSTEGFPDAPFQPLKCLTTGEEEVGQGRPGFLVLWLQFLESWTPEKSHTHYPLSLPSGCGRKV